MVWASRRQALPTRRPLRVQRHTHLPQVLCLHVEFGLRQLQMFLQEDSSDVKNLKASHTPGPRGSVPDLLGRYPAHRCTQLHPQSYSAHSHAPVPPKYLQLHKLSPELLLRSLLTQLFPSVVEKLRTEIVSAWLKGLGVEGIT